MKRKNNEGSIFYNSSRNRWNAQYKIKEDGKIKIKTKSFKNKANAEDFIDIIMYERNANEYIKNHGVNLVSFMKSRALVKYMVGVTGVEPATSWSQTTRATNCATPRYIFIYTAYI